MKSINTHSRKLLNIAKLVLLPLTLGFIIYKLFFAYKIDDIISGFSLQWTSLNIFLLSAVVIFMGINWWIEVVKWKFIMIRHEPVTLLQAWKAVLSGITLSIITPNQIGDVAGRVSHLRSYDKIKGAVASLIGSIAQMIATIMIGAFAIWWIGFKLNKYGSSVFIGGYVIIIAILCLILYFYFHIQRLNKVIRWEKIRPYIDVCASYNPQELLKILLLSLLRFSVFSFQYYLLLRFFNVNIPVLPAMACITAIFFIQWIVPSFILIEIGVRGATAIFFLSLFSDHIAGILLAAYSLWIINLMFPALVGMLFLLKLKPVKNS